eukprot:TRINITY_DN2484_c0_g2_i1.p1 TRINITY_DN2484_c0_g2~~TRINITY_DN2484_c0_g2_i1.p1  ORF type:complete len:1384 (+),score=324.50 TRINITY_DN2484_c0_g2_i1:581-4153(+)
MADQVNNHATFKFMGDGNPFRFGNFSYSSVQQIVGYTPKTRLQIINQQYDGTQVKTFVVSELTKNNDWEVNNGLKVKENANPSIPDVNLYYGHANLTRYNFTVSYKDAITNTNVHVRQIFIKNTIAYNPDAGYSNQNAIGVRVMKIGTVGLACMGPIDRNNTKEFPVCAGVALSEVQRTFKLVTVDNKFAFVVNPGQAGERVALVYVHPTDTYNSGNAGITFFSDHKNQGIESVKMVNTIDDIDRNFVFTPTTQLNSGNILDFASKDDFQKFIPFRTFGNDPGLVSSTDGLYSTAISKAYASIPTMSDMFIQTTISDLSTQTTSTEPFKVFFRTQSGVGDSLALVVHKLDNAGPVLTYWEKYTNASVKRFNARHYPYSLASAVKLDLRAQGGHYEARVDDNGTPIIFAETDDKTLSEGGLVIQFRQNVKLEELKVASFQFPAGSNPPVFPNTIYQTPFSSPNELASFASYFPPEKAFGWKTHVVAGSGNSFYSWKSNQTDSCMSFGPDRVSTAEIRFSIPDLNAFEFGLLSNQSCGKSFGMIFAMLGSKYGSVCMHDTIGDNPSAVLPSCHNTADIGRLPSFSPWTNASDFIIQIKTNSINPGMPDPSMPVENSTITVYHNKVKLSTWFIQGKENQTIGGGFYLRTFNVGTDFYITGQGEDSHKMVFSTVLQNIAEKRNSILLWDSFNIQSTFWHYTWSPSTWIMAGFGEFIHNGTRSPEQKAPFDSVSSGDPSWADYSAILSWGGVDGARKARPILMVRSINCNHGIAIQFDAQNQTASAVLVTLGPDKTTLSAQPLSEAKYVYVADFHKEICKNGLPCHNSSLNGTLMANVWKNNVELYAESMLVFKGTVPDEYSMGQVCLGVNNTLPAPPGSTYFRNVKVECGIRYIDTGSMSLEIEVQDQLIIKMRAKSENNVCTGYQFTNPSVILLNQTHPSEHKTVNFTVVQQPDGADGTPKFDYIVQGDKLPTKAGQYSLAVLINNMPAYGSGTTFTINPGPPAYLNTKIIANSIPSVISAGQPLGFVTLQLFDPWGNKAKGAGGEVASLTANGFVLVTGHTVFSNQVNITVPEYKINATGEYQLAIRFGAGIYINETLGNITVIPLNATQHTSKLVVQNQPILLAGNTTHKIFVDLRDRFNNPTPLVTANSLTVDPLPLGGSASIALNYPGQTMPSTIITHQFLSLSSHPFA